MKQPAVTIPHFCQNESGGILCGPGVFGLIQNPGSQRQRSNHQTVPVGQNLIVFERVNPILAGLKQFLADFSPLRFNLLFGQIQLPGPLAQRFLHMKDVGSGYLSAGFVGKIAARFQIQYFFPYLRMPVPQHLSELVDAPYIKFTFFAFAVGIFGREKCTFRRCHIS